MNVYINYDEIESKHKDLIDVSKEYMININDFEHDINHINDVLFYTKKLISKLDNYPYILKGDYKGYSYETEAALRVGWDIEV